MATKILAISGSYRKNGMTDQNVDAILESAQKEGAEVEKIYLTERHIEFCTNCRSCCKTNPGDRRGRCVLRDDLEMILDKVDAADGLVLASSINFYTVTAVMKRFVERLIVYGYWPWEQHTPKDRIKARNKKAVLVVTSACPEVMARFLMPNARQILKASAEIVGARVIKSLHIGMTCLEEHQRLTEKQRKQAAMAGKMLA